MKQLSLGLVVIVITIALPNLAYAETGLLERAVLSKLIQSSLKSSSRYLNLIQDIETQELELKSLRDDYSPYLSVNSSYTGQNNNSLTNTNYDFGTSQSNSSTSTDLTSYSPSAEVALIKKFRLGPELKFFGAYSNNVSNASVSSVGQATSVLDQAGSRYSYGSQVGKKSYGLQVSWPLLGSGASEHQTFKQRYLLSSSKVELEIRTLKLDYLNSVLSAYFSWAQGKIIDNISQALAAVAKQNAQIERSKYSAGERSILDIQKGDVRLQTILIQREKETLTLIQTEEKTKEILGFVPNKVPELPLTFPDSLLLEKKETLFSKFKNHNTLWHLNELSRLLNDIELKAEKLSEKPTLSLSAGLGQDGYNQEPLVGNWSVAVNYSHTYNPAQNNHTSKKQQLRKNKNLRSFESEAKSLKRQFELSYIRHNANTKSLQQAYKLLLLTTSDYSLKNSKYETGLLDFQTVLNAKSDVLEQKKQVANQLFKTIHSWLQIQQQTADLLLLSGETS